MSFFEKNVNKSDTVSLILFRGKIFIPMLTKYDCGQIIHTEPVFVCDLDLCEITSSIKKVLDGQKNTLPNPESWKEIFKNAGKPVLKKTQMRSWKKLTIESTSYLIDWTENHVKLSISQLDKKGIQEFPKELDMYLEHDIKIEEIVRIIMDDFPNRIGYKKI